MKDGEIFVAGANPNLSWHPIVFTVRIEQGVGGGGVLSIQVIFHLLILILIWNYEVEF